MVRIGAFLFWLFLFSGIPQLASATETVVLAGPPTAVAHALNNLLDELKSPEPRFRAEDIHLQLEVWDVSPILETGADDPDLVSGRKSLSVLHAELEAAIQRPLPLRNRALSPLESDAFKEQVADTAELLWPLYEKLGIREVPRAPSFLSKRELLWQSVTNPINLKKAAARFIILGTLTATFFEHFKGLTLQQSAVLGTVAGGLSFLLMATNDLYAAFLDSPFLTKIPSPQYWRALEADPRHSGLFGRFKQAAMTSVKDLLVYAGYLAIFTYASIKVGATPENWDAIIQTFFKGCALGVAAETALKAATARAATRAISRAQKEAGPTSDREIRRIRNLAATVAFFQSITYTPFELSMSLGHGLSEAVMWGLSGLGLTSYLLVMSPPESKPGKIRDNHLFPILFQFSNWALENLRGGMAGSCRLLTAWLRS